MPDTVSRTMFNGLLPGGAIWVPAIGQDFDLLLEGISDNAELMRDFLASLADVRNPQRTTILADLEKEYGVIFNPTLTEQERRDQLAAIKTDNRGDGTDTGLELKLQAAGFDLQVHKNEPPVDPAIILASTFSVYCDGDGAFCGHEDAFCGQSSGVLLVNGDLPEAFSSPASSDYWHLISFVGGDATRDGVTDELLGVQAGAVSVARQGELIRLIVRYKPLHQWIGLIVEFTSPEGPGFPT